VTLCHYARPSNLSYLLDVNALKMCGGQHIYDANSSLELPGIYMSSEPRIILFDTVSFDDP
jgi:hypothetical protein